ncbi:MAG: hypothetical protein ACOY3P_10135 [Planctomycetota bacterium]
MRRMYWIGCLWPGLCQIWLQGSWFGLGLAVLAAAMLNAALLCTFVWTEVLQGPSRSGLWLAVVGLWIGSAVAASRCRRRGAIWQCGSSGKDRLEEAVGHYLKGSWFEAELALAGILQQNTRDIEARLLLATLLRHAGRLGEAVAQLDALDLFEGAERWEWERRRERQLIIEALASATNEEESHPVGAKAAEPDCSVVGVRAIATEEPDASGPRTDWQQQAA